MLRACVEELGDTLSRHRGRKPLPIDVIHRFLALAEERRVSEIRWLEERDERHKQTLARGGDPDWWTNLDGSAIDDGDD